MHRKITLFENLPSSFCPVTDCMVSNYGKIYVSLILKFILRYCSAFTMLNTMTGLVLELGNYLSRRQ